MYSFWITVQDYISYQSLQWLYDKLVALAKLAPIGMFILALKGYRLAALKWNKDELDARERWRRSFFEAFKDPRIAKKEKAVEWIADHVLNEEEIYEAAEIYRSALRLHHDKVGVDSAFTPIEVQEKALERFRWKQKSVQQRADDNRLAIQQVVDDYEKGEPQKTEK